MRHLELQLTPDHGLSRLHQATGFWGSGNAAANFSYDPWGDIDKRHVGDVNLGYQSDAVSNPLLSATFSGDVGLNYNRSFRYDGNGNVTSDGVKTYRYDYQFQDHQIYLYFVILTKKYLVCF